MSLYIPVKCLKAAEHQRVRERLNRREWSQIYAAGTAKTFSSAIPQCHIRMLQRDNQEFVRAYVSI